MCGYLVVMRLRIRLDADLIAREHEWDDDPAGWVTAQRSNDSTRVG